jgi:hypothetical protein
VFTAIYFITCLVSVGGEPLVRKVLPHLSSQLLPLPPSVKLTVEVHSILFVSNSQAPDPTYSLCNLPGLTGDLSLQPLAWYMAGTGLNAKDVKE